MSYETQIPVLSPTYNQPPERLLGQIILAEYENGRVHPALMPVGIDPEKAKLSPDMLLRVIEIQRFLNSEFCVARSLPAREPVTLAQALALRRAELAAQAAQEQRSFVPELV